MSKNSNESEVSPARDRIKNHVSGFKVAAMERFSNPIFYSFLISWSIFNWDRIAVLLLSKQNIIDRISTIKDMPSNSTLLFNLPYANTIIFPLISTIFLVVLSPFINNVIYSIHSGQIKKKIANQEALNIQRYSVLISTIDARVQYESAEESKKLEIKETQMLIKARTTEAESQIANLKKQQSELNEDILNNNIIRNQLIEDNKKLTDLIAISNSNHTEILESINSKTKQLNELTAEIGTIKDCSERIKPLELSIKKARERIEALESQYDETHSIFNSLIEHLNTTYREKSDVEIRSENEIRRMISSQITKFSNLIPIP